MRLATDGSVALEVLPEAEEDLEGIGPEDVLEGLDPEATVEFCSGGALYLSDELKPDVLKAVQAKFEKLLENHNCLEAAQVAQCFGLKVEMIAACEEGVERHGEDEDMLSRFQELRAEAEQL